MLRIKHLLEVKLRRKEFLFLTASCARKKFVQRVMLDLYMSYTNLIYVASAEVLEKTFG